jgi:hypothetical protein
MSESLLSELMDEFAPEDDVADVDDEPIPTPEPAKRKRRRNHHYAGYVCPCSDCMRREPVRAAEQAEKRASKPAAKRSHK